MRSSGCHASGPTTTEPWQGSLINTTSTTENRILILRFELVADVDAARPTVSGDVD